MKTKLYIFLFTVIFNFSLVAQGNQKYEATAGMGIGFEHSASVIDYLNFNYASLNPVNDAFNSAIEAWGEVNYRYSENIKIGLEYNFNYFAYSNVTSIGYVYEFNKTVHSISPLVYFIIEGNGYELKFGGGLGIRQATISEKIYQAQNYSSTGFGILARAQALTSLGNNFYANLGVGARFDYLGTPETSGSKLVNDTTNEEVNISSLTFLVRIGVSYLF